MSGAYVELEHPADLFLEIGGDTLDDLFENALYALYSQVSDLQGIGTPLMVVLDVWGDSLDEALRTLLSEALYRFDAEGFVGTSARVAVQVGGADRDHPSDKERVRATARLWGGRPKRRPGALLTEVKAVTYHRLEVTRSADGGWRATVLLDV